MNTDAQEVKTWLTPDQVQQLRNACYASEVPTYLQEHRLALLELMYDTGLRRSEVAGLNVEDLQLEGAQAQVRIPSEIQKRLPNGEQR